jgi:hypothetical protein
MDVQLRELERKANAGDYEAAHQLQRARVRAGVTDIGNLPAMWVKSWNKSKDLPEDVDVWRYRAPGYATYAYVTGPLPKHSEDIEPSQESKRWKWEAGVMVCMYPKGSDRIKGYAASLEGAKRIVEVLCQETGTCLPKINKEKK